MKRFRAIYIGDIRFNQCSVFELNFKTNYFEMINDNEISYEKECVEEDGDFLIFEVINDRATLIEKKKFRRKIRNKRGNYKY